MLLLYVCYDEWSNQHTKYEFIISRDNLSREIGGSKLPASSPPGNNESTTTTTDIDTSNNDNSNNDHTNKQQ